MPTDWATADVRLKQRSYAQVQLRLLLLLPCLAMAMAAGAAAETATPRTIAHGMAPGRIAGEQRVVGFPCNPPRTAGGRLSFENCEDDISRNRGESGARDFLRHYGEALGLDGGGSDLELVEVKHGLASTSSRFIQRLHRLPVHGSWITVRQSDEGRVRAVHSSYRSPAHHYVTGRRASVSFDDAREAAMARAGSLSLRLPVQGELVWYPRPGGRMQLSWRLLVPSAKPLGDFLTIVNAANGKVLMQENRMAFHHVTGSGLVYAPNPMQSSGDTSLADNNDAAGGLLDSERSSVVLAGLNAGTGLLIGEFADLTLTGGLSVVAADEATRVYEYDRDDPRFEQVNVYHAIDSVQRYFHSLGFDDHSGTANGIRDFATLANAHWDDDDQSFYSTANDAVHFGDGGVDDAEDADIVLHEYGHAVQANQNSCWGDGEMGAMGEGFGDYLAATFYAASGNAAYQAANAACVGEWDASSLYGTIPPCLRRVDGNKLYPTDLVGSVHADGEIWSRALWDLRSALGAAGADTLILEHHFSVPCAATRKDAALEIVAADVSLNGGMNDYAIRRAFCDRGILTGADCPPVQEISLSLQALPTRAEAGELVTLTLTALNATGQNLGAVLLSAPVAAATSYVAGSATGGGVESGGVITWPAAAMTAGQTLSHSYQLRVDAGFDVGLWFKDDMEEGAQAWTVSRGVGSNDWQLLGAVGGGTAAARHACHDDCVPGGNAAAQIPSEGPFACIASAAGSFPCNNVDLDRWLSVADLGGGSGNDSWGWTDPASGREYAIYGRSTGTSFIDVTSPAAPVYLGDLPTHSSSSDWRDIKVFAGHAFIVSEATGHGLQVFDLAALENVASPPVTFSETAHYAGFSTAHNVAVNEDSGFAFVVGSDQCAGGLYMLDVSTPASPAFAGCFDADGYTHDVQCVVYAGPDIQHTGKEICVASNEDTVTVVDVSDKSLPVMLSRTSYPGVAYIHQAWLSEDHGWLLVDDEGDETDNFHNTRTYVFDMSDLDQPLLSSAYTSQLGAVDHNQYVVGNLSYQANYTAGLRILDISDIANGRLCELASFDVYPADDSAAFAGAWSVYPFFPSGTVIVSSMDGLAVVRPDLSAATCTGQGANNGHAWFAADPAQVSDQYLTMAAPLSFVAGATLKFWHSYNSEQDYDGGVVEISVDGGVTWNDAGSAMTDNPYNSTLGTGFDNPLQGRAAFSGNGGGWLKTTVQLDAWAGADALIRFRMGSDSSVGGSGWIIDDVEVVKEAALALTATAGSDAGFSAQASLDLAVGPHVGECGDGVVDVLEDCDDGNPDPGDGCSNCTVDACFFCSGEPSLCVANIGAACDDGVNCNGADTCSAQGCDLHSGDPCTSGGECANVCDEASASCFLPAGTPCSNDGNPCTDDLCDGSGNCSRPPNSATCDDGVFCNGADTCVGGACAAHGGDPCAGGGDCLDNCREAERDCLAPAAAPCTGDGFPCTDDVCDGNGNCQHVVDPTCTTTTTTTTTTLPQSRPQQNCLASLNKSGAKVASVQGKVAAKCVKSGWKGQTADAETCFTADPRGKLAKATAKTVKADSAKCTAVPDFGYTGAAAVNAAATSERLALTADLFGNDVDQALTDAAGKCQTALAKETTKLADAKDKVFVDCKRTGLRNGSVASTYLLESCFDQVRSDPKGRVAKKRGRLEKRIASRCGGLNLAVAFPGACAQAPDLGACIDRTSYCRLCRSFNAMDALDRDCDIFDDGLENLSCN